MADFHGRDPQLLLQNAQQFCMTLIDWADQGRNRDPNGDRVGMAGLLAHMTYPYTTSDVACLSAMAMVLLDAIVAGQPTEFESAARSLNIQPRLTRPPSSTSASPFALPPPLPATFTSVGHAITPERVPAVHAAPTSPSPTTVATAPGELARRVHARHGPTARINVTSLSTSATENANAAESVTAAALVLAPADKETAGLPRISGTGVQSTVPARLLPAEAPTARGP